MVVAARASGVALSRESESESESRSGSGSGSGSGSESGSGSGVESASAGGGAVEPLGVGVAHGRVEAARQPVAAGEGHIEAPLDRRLAHRGQGDGATGRS